MARHVLRLLAAAALLCCAAAVPRQPARRALQHCAACDSCIQKGNSFADCEEFGVDCACYRGGAGSGVFRGWAWSGPV